VKLEKTLDPVFAEIGPWEGETTEEMLKFLAEAHRHASQRRLDGP
jgi:hypothetical protein